MKPIANIHAPFLKTSTNAGCPNLNTGLASITNLGSATVQWLKLGQTGTLGSANPITGLAPGAYIAEIKDAGCTSNEPFRLNVSVNGDKFPIVPDLENSGVCSNGGTANFNATALNSTGTFNYVWSSTPSGFSSGLSNVNPAVSSSPTTFMVTVTNPSNGCMVSKSASAVITSITNDCFIKDEPLDTGIEPNANVSSSQLWFLVNGIDVWVRNSPEAMTSGIPNQHFTNEHNHQNVEFANSWASDNFTLPRIYVKVRNRGCNTVNGTVRIYYHVLSMTDNWNSTASSPGLFGDWQEIFCDDVNGNSIVDSPSESNNCNSNQVTVGPGQETVVEQTWYSAKAFANPGTSGQQYCLLVRFDSGQDIMNPPEANGQAAMNAWNENNIVQKNVWFYDNVAGIVCNNLGFGNSSSARTINKLEIVERSDKPFAGQQGQVRVDLGETVFNEWVNGGRQGQGFVYGREKYRHTSPDGVTHYHDGFKNDTEPYEIHLKDRSVVLENIGLNPAIQSLCINVDPYYGPGVQDPFVFSFAQNEIKSPSLTYSFTGAAIMNVIKPDCPQVNAGLDVAIGRGCSTILTANPNIQGATYIWRNNANGKEIGSTRTITVSPNQSASYEVEMRTPQHCLSYDVVNVSLNTNLPSCRAICGQPDFVNEIITSNTTISGASVVKKTVQVASGVKLTIINSTVNFTKDAELIINQGGKIEIINSVLTACDITNPWKGITVKGNNSDDLQFKMTDSRIDGAVTAFSLTEVVNPIFIGNSFDNGTTAIKLTKCSKFTIQKNQFTSYSVGIHVINTQGNYDALIKENFFTNVGTAILIEKGTNSALDIACNTFMNYTDYAIYSDSTILKSQGTSLEGAGNVFVSSSTKTNHRLRHNGNTINYFFDPSAPISLSTVSGLSAVAVQASADALCGAALNAKLFGNNIDKPDAGVTNAKQDEIFFNAFPNPFLNELTITYHLPVNAKSGHVKIYEAASGKLIFESALNTSQNKIEINNINISAGLYICQISTDNGMSKQFKLVNIK